MGPSRVISAMSGLRHLCIGMGCLKCLESRGRPPFDDADRVRAAFSEMGLYDARPSSAECCSRFLVC
jgi:hypothetical protein